MGDSTPQPNAQSLRAELEGLSRFDQHSFAYAWALEHHCAIDLFGDFAKERSLILFRSGNESENWLDIKTNFVYKMNTLMHVGEDIARLLRRIELFNELFPDTALIFVGFQLFSKTHVCPVFKQPFIDAARFATTDEIQDYMEQKGFHATGTDGEYSDDKYILSDMRPKNVLVSYSGAVAVIDADVVLIK